MTIIISPGAGAAPLFTQQGVGTSPGYAALDDRRANNGSLQEGVYGTSTLVTAGGVGSTPAADFMVTQRGAGANMSVDVNMPGGGFAYVQGDTITGQGLYTVPVHSANINETIATADASKPRIDSVILEVQDNVLDASGGNLARTRVLTGTATTGTTLDSRAGAPSLPGNALLLADVLVGAAASSIVNAVIRDRRKWARGAFYRQPITGGTASTSATTLGALGGVSARAECSGVPVRITLVTVASNNTAGDGVGTGCNLDGSGIDGVSLLGNMTSAASNQTEEAGYVYVSAPSAGSHLFQPTFQAVSGGTASLFGSSVQPGQFIVEEVVRQNTQNNTVTSG